MSPDASSAVRCCWGGGHRVQNVWSKLPSTPSLVMFSSVTQSCPALCDPMNCSTPGLPAHHQLPEFTQTHVHRVSDAIQPSRPLLSPSPPASSWKNFPQFVVIHTVKGCGGVNKAVDVFLEVSCCFDDPADVGNLVSGSSAISKSSLNIWKFTVHVLLKPGFIAVFTFTAALY